MKFNTILLTSALTALGQGIRLRAAQEDADNRDRQPDFVGKFKGHFTHPPAPKDAPQLAQSGNGQTLNVEMINDVLQSEFNVDGNYAMSQDEARDGYDYAIADGLQLPPFEEMYARADKNGDGKICIDEMYHAINLFLAEKEADFMLRGKEFLNQEEAKNCYNRAIAEGHDLPPFDVLFKSTDKNGDGKLGKKEIVAGIMRQNAVQEIRASFQNAELNPDGDHYFSQGEAKANYDLAVESGIQLPPFAEVFTKLDQNGDGKLCVEELIAALDNENALN